MSHACRGHASSAITLPSRRKCRIAATFSGVLENDRRSADGVAAQQTTPDKARCTVTFEYRLARLTCWAIAAVFHETVATTANINIAQDFLVAIVLSFVSRGFVQVATTGNLYPSKRCSRGTVTSVFAQPCHQTFVFQSESA
jgi:hypothetical protein